MKRTDETKTLSLRRETLRELTDDDLLLVVAGTTGRCGGMTQQ